MHERGCEMRRRYEGRPGRRRFCSLIEESSLYDSIARQYVLGHQTEDMNPPVNNYRPILPQASGEGEADALRETDGSRDVSIRETSPLGVISSLEELLRDDTS